MEAHLAPIQPTQVNIITSSCEICSGPHDTQYYMENPEQAFVEYASSRNDEARGKWYTFKSEQNNLSDTNNPSWKSHPISGGDNPKIPKIIFQTHLTGSNPMVQSQTVPSTIILKALIAEEEEREREGNHEGTKTIAHNEEQRDTPQLELKDTTAVDNLGPNRDDEGIEWLDVEEPLDLVDTSEESVYESLIKEMPKCSLNYDFRIKKGYP
ncbi:hypothetical protein Tco_0758028 [Tanacetum coccineum]